MLVWGKQMKYHCYNLLFCLPKRFLPLVIISIVSGAMSFSLFFFSCNVAAAGSSEAITWHPVLDGLLEKSRKTWSTSNPGLPSGLTFPVVGTFKTIQGEDHLVRIDGKEHVELKNLSFAIAWKGQQHHYRTTLIVISNCEEVLIDNIHLLQLDKDARAAYTILVENCGRVVVKNSSFRGTGIYHLRFEGCREVLIDSVEIAGVEYAPNQVRCGGGIWINNGDDSPGKYQVSRGLNTKNPRDLTHFAILNSWFHDSLDEEQYKNVDGVLVHSGAQGLISNCRFENWQKGDTALDVSHRRLDEGYDRKLIRVERNIFSNCRLVKSSGRSNPGCRIIWCNNVFTDTPLADYHKGYEVIHSFEDFIFTEPSTRFLALWGLRDGTLRIEHCLFVLPHNKVFLHQGEAGTSKDYMWVSSDFNIFYLGIPMDWVSGQGIFIKKITDWQAMGNDRHSWVFPLNPQKSIDARSLERILGKGLSPPLELVGAHIPQSDYLGKPRGREPYVGALLPPK